MSSPKMDSEEPTSSNDVGSSEGVRSSAADSVAESAAAEPRPPAKRPLASTVIEISDTESDDSDICAVTSYQASADEVKRIRGDYSSSSSSSDSYSSDSESPWEDDSIILEDVQPIKKLVRAQLNPRADRTEDPKLNPKLKSQEIIDKLKMHWEEHKALTSEEVTLTCEPFRLCLLHDLLENSDIINNIVDDMNTLDWERKKMDLYEFHQTVDLANLTWQRSIKGIYELLKTEVMSWVSQVTGLELTSVSASCSLYGPGDHLLVHDDLLADRRVAFILYLAPWTPPASQKVTTVLNGDGDHRHVEQVDVECCGWSEDMGGALELFARDEEGRPTEVTHKVLPRNNMLAFFQVGVDSFHQVGEVLSLELPRLSINGWFHGAPPPPPPPPPPPRAAPPHPPLPPPPDLLTPHNDIVLISEWVESAYMSPVSRGHIQTQMERESEVSLRDFLQQRRVRELLDALGSPDLEWEMSGPANQRRYRVVSARAMSALPASHPLRALLALWSSSAFCKLLRDCTDLHVAHYAALQLQRWAPADFTLIPPRSQYGEARLEAVLYLGAAPLPVCGAATVYLAPEEEGAAAGGPHDGALVTVTPHHNALSLVYCDGGAASFTKYLSKMAMRPDDCFYILTCTYKE